MATLQDCFESTQQGILREAASKEGSVDLQKYTESFLR